MNRDDVIAKLRAIMLRSTPATVAWDVVTDRTRIDALGFDSLSILDLIYDIQQGFGLEFELEELAQVATVGDLVSFLERRVAG